MASVSTTGVGGTRWSNAAEVVRRAACILRTMIGVPDYDRYLEHMRHKHPDATPLTRDEFARQRMDRRYSTPGSRCC